jgi:hypothetical protein
MRNLRSTPSPGSSHKKPVVQGTGELSGVTEKRRSSAGWLCRRPGIPSYAAIGVDFRLFAEPYLMEPPCVILSRMDILKMLAEMREERAQIEEAILCSGALGQWAGTSARKATGLDDNCGEPPQKARKAAGHKNKPAPQE